MKVLKLSLLTLSVCIMGFTGFAQKASEFTSDQIIQKHIDAIGGAKNWDKIKSVKLTGTMSVQGNAIDMVQTMADGKGMRIEITAMGQTGYTIITPTEGWMFMPFLGQTKPEALPADQLKSQQQQLNFRNTQLADKSLISKSSLVGRDTIDKATCYKLKVTGAGGTEQTCYIDAKSFYLVRTEMNLDVQGEQQEIAVTYADFKTQPEGIVVPMTYATPQGDLKFKSIEINKPVDDKIFKP